MGRTRKAVAQLGEEEGAVEMISKGRSKVCSERTAQDPGNGAV